MSPFSAPRQPAVALNGGSPTDARGKMESRLFSEDPSTCGEARGVANRRGGG
jgi:hypothetical protein